MIVSAPQESKESGFDSILIQPKSYHRTGIYGIASLRLQD
jgi:hypothetical protein